MKIKLFDFQEQALSDLRNKLTIARSFASLDNPQAISFSAPTGSGKTIVMTALFENIFLGELGFVAQPDAVILWISDMPELNAQTRLKIEGKSDRIRVNQLATIDTSFDAERFDGGRIYFMNVQKLGTDKLLTREGDARQYPIWQTLTNTAKAIPDRFYVVIDEAHRGMGVGAERSAEKAKTIMQRFLLGSEEDGLIPMPLVIGISATPQRFERLLADTTHSVHKVYVKSEDVRRSGLIKDRILIHYPQTHVKPEMTLLSEAVNRWKRMKKRWATFSEAESEEKVLPILVIQVEDGSEKTLTRTSLADVINTVESALGRQLQNGEVVHAFHETSDLPIAGHQLKHIEASRIEEDQAVGVVLFKMSLSTGWDCPRAEVMMSFRPAHDHTYIAQLLGRMVRTPLARRIEKDAALNDVHLFLPHYDQATVEAVIEDLRNEEDVPPTVAGTSRQLVTLQRRVGTEEIFEATSELITYRVNAVRKQSALVRLMGLGRGLTHDEIDMEAQGKVKEDLVRQMSQEIKRMHKTDEFEATAKTITELRLTTTIVKGREIAEEEAYEVGAAVADIERLFDLAGRRLGNGLHTEYWKTQSERDAQEVRVEVIVMAQDLESMKNLEKFASTKFEQLYKQHKRKFARLPEQRRQHYDELRLAAPEPQDIPWILPESIDSKRSPDAPILEKHLYVEEDGNFRVELGTWERGVIEEELQNPEVVAWLRNVDRKTWSLEIPYRDAGTIKPMFPDLLIIRQDNEGYVFDILEPHDPSLKDNWAKAVGFAEFADKHWNLFGRIQLIRKQSAPNGQDRYYRLDMGDEAVREQVRGVSSNNELDRLFDKAAKIG